MEEIIRALELKNQLDVLRPLDKEQEARIMQKFRLDWNYHSNNLEGNSLTYGETKALIMHGITAQGKPLKDHFEITGHNEAINWLIEVVKDEYPLTESFIRGLHEMLLKDFYDEKKKKGIKTGPYKSTGNHVITQTGETLYFATPEETPAEMAALMEWYGEKVKNPDFNPIFLAAEFHYRFIRIHPFDDGNGRTARLLMNFILMKFGYPPVVIKTEDKKNYLGVLQMADSGNLEAFIQYIAKNLNHSLEIMIAGANGEDIDEADDIDKEIALLERRLAAYGEEIEKEKSKETINDIYVNSIHPLIENLKTKLEIFEKFYLESNVYVQLDGQQYDWPDIPPVHFKSAREIIIGAFYRQLKKVGKEDNGFSYNIYFEFNMLNYNIYIDRRTILYTKNYNNLSDKEIRYLTNLIIADYKERIDIILKS